MIAEGYFNTDSKLVFVARHCRYLACLRVLRKRRGYDRGGGGDNDCVASLKFYPYRISSTVAHCDNYIVSFPIVYYQSRKMAFSSMDFSCS